MSLFFNDSGRMRVGFQALVFFMFGAALILSLQTLTRMFGIAEPLPYPAVLYPLEAAGLYGISLFAFALFEDGTAAPLGLWRKGGGGFFGLGAVLGIAAIAAIFLAIWFPLRASNPLVMQWDVVKTRSFGLGLVTFLFAAIFEELGFRGFPFLALKKSLGRWGATVLLSICFVAVHPNFYHVPTAWISIFLGGVLFTQLFVLTGSLWTPIAFHFLWNFSQYVIFPLSGRDRALIAIANFDPTAHGLAEGIEESRWAAGVLALAVVVAEVVLYRRKKSAR